MLPSSIYRNRVLSPLCGLVLAVTTIGAATAYEPADLGSDVRPLSSCPLHAGNSTLTAGGQYQEPISDTAVLWPAGEVRKSAIKAFAQSVPFLDETEARDFKRIIPELLGEKKGEVFYRYVLTQENFFGTFSVFLKRLGYDQNFLIEGARSLITRSLIDGENEEQALKALYIIVDAGSGCDITSLPAPAWEESSKTQEWDLAYGEQEFADYLEAHLEREYYCDSTEDVALTTATRDGRSLFDIVVQNERYLDTMNQLDEARNGAQ